MGGGDIPVWSINSEAEIHTHGIWHPACGFISLDESNKEVLTFHRTGSNRNL